MTENIPDAGAATSPGADPHPDVERRRSLCDELRQEAESTVARSERAALLFDAGALAELLLARPAQAVQDYLAAYNADPRLSLALQALLRLFERRISRKNLLRLYEAALRDARTPDGQAAALVDLAALELLQEGEEASAAADEHLARALELAPAPDAALLREFAAARRMDFARGLEAAATRSALTDDPLERAALLLEAALADERAGAPLRARDKLTQAIAAAPELEVLRAALDQLALRSGLVDELATRAAARATDLASGSPGGLALLYELSRIERDKLGDPARAVATLDRALAAAPHETLFLTARMLSHDSLGDGARAADDAAALLAAGARGELAAALSLRVADAAEARGDVDAARRALSDGLAAVPGGLVGEALLDDVLIRAGDHLGRIARREARARGLADQPGRAARLLGEAARIACVDTRDTELTVSLYTRALELAPEDPELVRDAYGAALVLASPKLASLTLPPLLADEHDPEQRAALVHHRLDLLDRDERLARELLRSELAREGHSPALLPIARARAAEASDFTLLADVHARLAQRRAGSEADAHRIASARAAARAGDAEAALAALEQLSGTARSQRYVLGLFEELLGRLGRRDELTRVLRASRPDDDSTVAEETLLLSAARLEAAREPAQALAAYQAALEAYPSSRAATSALAEQAFGTAPSADVVALLARRAETASDATEQAHYALFAELAREADAPASAPDPALLARLVVPEAPEEALVYALTAPRVADEVRVAAQELLEAHIDGSDRAMLARESGGRAIALGEPQAVVFEAVERTLALAPNDAWAAWTRTVVPLPHDEQGHVDALSELARASGSRAIEQAMTAEILWVRRLDGQGALAADMPAPLHEERGAGLFTHVLASAHPARDNELLARAYRGSVALDLTHDPLEAELGCARAHLAGGRLPEAKASVDSVLAIEPGNLVALELALHLARESLDQARLAELTERLGMLAPDPLGLELLEESAVVRRSLDDAHGEERVLKAALARAPTRATTYGLLHELFVERGNGDALIALVEKRTEVIDEPAELVKCFYELARLHRARGELAAALDAIDSVLMLEEHVGALALAAEIHTVQESYADAVSALSSLAKAPGTPMAQRRVARLGAADFLEHRLFDVAGAIAQLEALLAESPDELPAWLKLADLAERTGKGERAVSALLGAREHAAADARRSLTLRAAALLEGPLERPAEARALYRALARDDASDRTAVFALQKLGGDAEALAAYSVVLENELAKRPADPALLRDIAACAAMRGRTDDEWMALAALTALGYAEPVESSRCDELSAKLREKLPRARAVGTSEREAVRAPELSAPYRKLIEATFEAARDLDQLTPGRYGVGRAERNAARALSELRELAELCCRRLGLVLGDIYLGGDDLTRLQALPDDKTVHLVCGLGVGASLSPQRRVRLALQLSGTAMRTLPLLPRSAEQAERLMLAALLASEVQVDTHGRDVSAQARALGRDLPRKVKRALPELYRALPDGGRALKPALVRALSETRAVALLLVPELPAMLDDTLSLLPPNDALHAAADTNSLLGTWTSQAFRTLRSKLELTL